MSREERRAYQRMMKNMDRGPALPPAARARVERTAAKRAQRKKDAPPPGTFTRGYVVRSLLVAFAIGYLAFSFQWSEGVERALTVGTIAGVVVLGLMVGFKLLQRRLPAPPAS